MTGRALPKKSPTSAIKDRFITYLFSCGDDGTVIDGFGTAMFINHSCDPNCETEDMSGRIFVVAIRDIAAGEELTYEYNLLRQRRRRGRLLLRRGQVPGNDVQRG